MAALCFSRLDECVFKEEFQSLHSVTPCDLFTLNRAVVSCRGPTSSSDLMRETQEGFYLPEYSSHRSLRLYFERFCFIYYMMLQLVRVPGYRSRGPGFDSWRYKIFLVVLDLERGPLSFVRIIDELLEKNSSGSRLENRI
jgi:hypothetical protein